MKQQIFLGILSLLVLFAFPVTASLGPTRKAERAEVKENLQEFKNNRKSRGIKIVDGIVTFKDASSLNVTNNGKIYIVKVDSNTRYRRRFWGASTFVEISTGNHVNVWGKITDEASNTILASMIRNLSVQRRRGAFMGTILSKTTNSFVMSTLERGNQTVTTGINTKFVKRNEQVMTFTNLKVGDKVRVKGVWDKILSTITEVTQVKDFSQPAKPSPTPTP